MGLDIYVGPASRYFAGNWETIIQQISAQEGIGCIVHRPKPVRKPLLARLIQRLPSDPYEAWKRQICRKLTLKELPWDESNGQDYSTDKLGFAGCRAFLHQYMYARNPQFKPPDDLGQMLFQDHPAFEIEFSQASSPVNVLTVCNFFLPITIERAFAIHGTTEPILVASLDTLDRALDEVCAYCNFDRKSLSSMELAQAHEGSSFEEAVLYACSLYSRLVGDARERKLPLILDW